MSSLSDRENKILILKLLIEKFVHNNCPLQVVCLTCMSSRDLESSVTDLSPYCIPGYHLISTPHYASIHGGSVL